MSDSTGLRLNGIVTPLLGTSTLASNGQITGYTGVATNASSAITLKSGLYNAFQAIVTGTGAITATVNIYGSIDGVNFCSTAIGTITLSGSDALNDGFSGVAAWKYVKAVLTNLTGTGAACIVLMSS